MKMSSQMVERALSQFEAEAVPENHPTVTQLNRLFGDHTFFIDESGLSIVEPTEPSESGAQAGVVVKLCELERLKPHQPCAASAGGDRSRHPARSGLTKRYSGSRST